jgi:YYY domain-containing protein
MPISDFWIVMRWWGTLFLVGAAAFPLTSMLFSSWYDRGYFFSKAVGFAIVTWIVFALGMAHLAPFTFATSVGVVAAVFILGVILTRTHGSQEMSIPHSSERIFWEELIFLAALLFWSWIKAHEPSIRGLEKFMDYGFMNSILHSRYFPPADMWYPPYSINYYYFGHLVTAILTRISGLELGYTFNLMLASIFALCLTMSFSIGYQISLISHRFQDHLKKRAGTVQAICSGLLTSFLVTMAGNMQTIYAFTKGYTGDAVVPFWNILWPVSDFLSKYPEGMNRYWYANATRFIPYTIHEFPSYSFVVSDVHGHVLSIPFVLLAIALLVVFFGGIRDVQAKVTGRAGAIFLQQSIATYFLIFYGFLVGVLLMTNALDGPIYLGLFILLVLVLFPGDWTDGEYWKIIASKVGIVIIAAGLSSLPFLAHFKSFVNGIAVDCPPAFLANSHVGPILFEAVEKCQKSPLWMMYLLWGFFWFCGSALIVKCAGAVKHFKDIPAVWDKKFPKIEKMLVIWFVFCTLLIIFPEFFYFKDIYPMHFRSNTMFKLGYDAFILYSIISAYVIVKAVRSMRTRWASRIVVLLLIPQLFLVCIYPLFSVRSYFGELKNYQSIWGLGWLSNEYPDNYAAMQWLDKQTHAPGQVLVEADGDSYTDYDQFSVFTGTPTVIGWAVHEWLWRGTYDIVSPRRDDVRLIYESENITQTKALLDRYAVRYVVVGTLERQKFTKLQELKFTAIGKEAFRHGETVIYEVGAK